MVNSIMIDTRLKNKIESMNMFDEGTCCVKFKDLEDSFWFDNKEELQEFINEQDRERFYDKELRKGYFLYKNEHNEVFKYNIKANRGKLTLVKEEFVYQAE